MFRSQLPDSSEIILRGGGGGVGKGHSETERQAETNARTETDREHKQFSTQDFVLRFCQHFRTRSRCRSTTWPCRPESEIGDVV